MSEIGDVSVVHVVPVGDHVCAGCANWLEEYGHVMPIEQGRDRDGVCKLNGPGQFLHPHSPGIATQWPVTRGDDWCGQWRDRRLSPPG